MRWYFASIILGLAAVGCESSGTTGSGGAGTTTTSDVGPTTSATGGGGGGAATSSTSSTGATTTTTSSSTSAGGSTGSSGGGSVGSFGCPCTDTSGSSDCADGLTCYPFGMGAQCTTACVDGACPLPGGEGCNNMDPPACKPPPSPVCGTGTGGGTGTGTGTGTGGHTGSGGGTGTGTGGAGAGGGSGLPFGSGCGDDGQCQSGLCYAFGMGGKVCTVLCPVDGQGTQQPQDCPGTPMCNNMDPSVCKAP